MQRYHTRFWCAWLGIALFVFLSCQKTVTMSSTSSSSPVFSASFAGVAWKADTVWASLLDDSANVEKVMTISGYGAERLVTIVISDSSQGAADSVVGLRSYAATNDLWNASAFTFAVATGSDTIWSTFGTGYSGQSTVTADNASSKMISGSFQFYATVLTADSTGIAIDTVKVTDGVFTRIPYGFRYLR